MKKIKIFATAFLLFTAIVVLDACKKNNDKKTCHISEISSPTSTEKNSFSYDVSGRLSQLISGGSLTTYSYSGSTTTVTILDSGKFLSRTTIFNNDAGLAINVRIEYDETGTIWNNQFFEYSGDELSKSTNTSSDLPKPIITTYTWSNGNMVSAKTDTTTTTYGYYTDKLRQTGDYFLLVQMIQGYEIIRNKNLLKSVSGSTLSYEPGPDGNISTLSVTTGGSTTSIDLHYLCN